MEFVGWIIWGGIWAAICAVVAARRGRDVLGWGIGGFIGGLITLLILLALKKKERAAEGGEQSTIES